MEFVRRHVARGRTHARNCRAGTALAAAIIIALVAGRSPGAQPSPRTAEIIKATGIDRGFCVQLGFGDGRLLLDLAASGAFVVHGLSHDLEAVHAARKLLISKKCYGQVSVERCSFKSLPYAENLVNVIVVEVLPSLLTKGLDMQEILRVLAPGGVLCLGGGVEAGALKEAGFQEVRTVGRWTVGTKVWPGGMDEWTHPRHGPDGNPVSHDTLIEPPTNLNWLYGPLWPNLGDDSLTSGGRNYYSNYSKYTRKRNLYELQVRDAYNGLPLWAHRTNPESWRTALQLKAVVGTRAYLVDPEGPLVVLDTMTGKRVAMSLKITLTGSSPLAVVGQRLIAGGVDGIVSADAHTGKLNWKVSPPKSVTDLVVGEDRVFLTAGPPAFKVRRGQGGPQILLCLDLKTGKEQWRVEMKPPFRTLLFVKYGLVLCHVRIGLKKPGSAEHQLYAHSVKDGTLAWTQAIVSSSYHRFYAAQGLIWSMPRQGAKLQALDPTNGKIKKTLEGKGLTLQCAQGGAATERYLIGNKLLEFVEMDTGKRIHCPVARNACAGTPGILLGNGLTYMFPKACQCSVFLRGYSGFSGKSDLRGTELAARLERGPAFSKSGATSKEERDSWPTYRHDARRTATTPVPVPTRLRLLWTTQLEDQAAPEAIKREWGFHPAHAGGLTAPVIAGGLVLVAAPNSHRVFAVAADDGKLRWTSMADARVSAPPCVAGGLCYFGAQDGWVYCLRLEDGQLVWRFRAAPGHRRIMAFGQPESQWPVQGGVMVQDGRVHFAAGRHSHVSGGITGYALNARSGKVLWKAKVEAGQHLADLPVSNGQGIRLAHPSKTPWILDPKTGSAGRAGPPMLLSKEGLLDYSLFYDRILAPRGRPFMQQYGDFTAQLLVFGGKRAFGFRAPQRRRDPKTGQKRNYPAYVASLVEATSTYEPWTTLIDPKILRVECMMLAGDTLFLAGPNEQDEGIILALSAATGKKLAEIQLPDAPRPEGLAAAYGKLYLATFNGKLLCYGR
jgi:outer membrane protein assembly factor BamB